MMLYMSRQICHLNWHVRGLDCLFEFQTLHDLYWKNTYWKILFNLLHFSCCTFNNTVLNKLSQSWYCIVRKYLEPRVYCRHEWIELYNWKYWQFQEILLRHVLAWQGPWSFLCNLRRLFESSLITFVNVKDYLLGALVTGLLLFVLCSCCCMWCSQIVARCMYLGMILNEPLMRIPHIRSFCLFVWFSFCMATNVLFSVSCNKYPSMHAVKTMIILVSFSGISDLWASGLADFLCYCKTLGSGCFSFPFYLRCLCSRLGYLS